MDFSVIPQLISKLLVFIGFSTFAEKTEDCIDEVPARIGLASLCVFGDILLPIIEFEPIWSMELMLGLKVEEIIEAPVELGIGGLALNRPLLTELYFSFSYLLNHWINWALLSKDLMDSSSLLCSVEHTFLVSVRSFSNFYLSIFNSLITLFFSVNSFCFDWICCSCF